MMKIRVVGFQGRPLADSPWAEFGDRGGTIGRTPENTLSLPDPQRHVSRIHATVSRSGGDYVITDLGTVNALKVNGRPLGQGNKAGLADGDELEVGDYVLSVRIEQQRPAATTQPFQERDIFADLMVSAPSPQGPTVPGPAQDARVQGVAASSAASIIPEDFDPFAAKPAPAQRPAATAGGLELGPAADAFGPSIDDLFGLSGASSEPRGTLPPLSEPPRPQAPAHDLLASPPRPEAAAGAQWDHTPEIHGSFQPPRARTVAEPAQPPAEAQAEEKLYLSWQSPEAGAASRSVVEVGERAAAAVMAQRPPPEAPSPEAGARPSPAGEAVQPAGEELLHAFVEGLGVAKLSVPGGVTPEFMRNVGQLLREATQGTLDLLLARAMTKREIRADATLIMGKDNNPLKFSPTVEVALSHLLAPMGGGFMNPQEAMKDAYADLRAHQFGFMVGMRAALAGVLARFDPDNLERRLAQKSVLDNLLSMNRRAKLWDLFTTMYGEISQEVEEDFHTVFGKEFLRGYEEQVSRLRDKQGT